MSLDEHDQQAITEISQRVTAEAIRNLVRGTGGATMPVPVLRMGTVQGTADVGTEAIIKIDGDAVTIPAVNAAGEVVEGGDRVLVFWTPPSGVYISGLLSRGSRGEFTPVISGSGASNTGASQYGHYVRTGHHVDFTLRWIFGSGSAMGNPTSLGGLPFPVITNGDGVPTTMAGYVTDATSGSYPIMWVVPEGTTVGPIYDFTSNGPAFDTITPTANFTWAIGDSITVQGSYLTDAA